MHESWRIDLTQASTSRRALLRAAAAGVLGVVGTSLMAACNNSSGTSASAALNPTRPPASAASPAAAAAAGAGAASGQTFTVNMTDALKFEPATLTVPKGATVTWKNTGQVPHTSTDDPSKAQDKSHAALPNGAQPWDSGTLDAGKTFSHAFDVPGTYKYFCMPHESAGMLGTITVSG